MKIKKFLVPQNIARRKLESNLVIVSNSLSLLVLVLVPPFEQSFNSDISQILRSTIIRNEYIKIHQDEVFQGSHAATVSHIITSPAYYGQHTRRRRRKHCHTHVHVLLRTTYSLIVITQGIGLYR